MLIQDGEGSGRIAGVNDEHRLKTSCVTTPGFLHTNDDHGNAYVWNFPSYDPDAGDTVMFLRNDSDAKMHVHHVYLYSDTATVLALHVISNGETPAGTAVTGVNLNIPSGNVAEATAKQDETGNTSQGTVIHTEYVAANEPLTMLKEDGYEIILGKNDCLAVDLVSAATATFGHIVGYYHA